MTDASLPSRSALIERRLQVLEMEAAIQRATLAATLAASPLVRYTSKG